MKAKRYAGTINVLGLDVDFSAYYTPGDPGRVSGPPEKCYPPEPPEVEVDELTTEDEQRTYDMMVLLQSDVADEICEKVIDAIEEGAE
jgi:hypothetical protein